MNVINRLKNLTTMDLVKIGAITGIATVFMGFTAKNKVQRNIKAMPFYKEALKATRTHKGAVYLLGEPIKDGLMNIDNYKLNFTKDNKAQYEVPLKGPKQKGTLNFWASKNSNSKWNVDRIELKVENYPDKVLVIKGGPIQKNTT